MVLEEVHVADIPCFFLRGKVQLFNHVPSNDFAVPVGREASVSPTSKMMVVMMGGDDAITAFLNHQMMVG